MPLQWPVSIHEALTHREVMMGNSRYITAAGAVFCAVTAGACSDTTGPAGADQLAVVSFAAVTPAPGQGATEGGSLELTGTNGTLRIDEMHIIVAEFELKRADDDVCVDGADDDDCEEFEAPPAFVDVPLDGSGVLAVQHTVPADTYRRFEFEIEDLDDDEDDPVVAQQIAALRAQIRAQFPEWPAEASMLVIGSFTPTGGEAVPFRVYFEAEIEIEMDLVPPVVIDGSDGAASFTVRIDPAVLFRNSDGTLRNIAELDYARTGSVVEFEVELENGISDIEFDD